MIKPYCGSKNRARLVHNMMGLKNACNGRMLYMQEYIPNGGYDTKIYVVGDEIYGLKRPSPLVKSYKKKEDEERIPFSVRKAIGSSTSLPLSSRILILLF